LEGIGIIGHGHSCDHVTAQESSLLKILYITNSGNFSNESNDLYISVLRNIQRFMYEVKLFDFILHCSVLRSHGHSCDRDRFQEIVGGLAWWSA
jgi:hypothetical protein